MATSTVSMLIETGRPGKMQQQLPQMTPRENGVATRNTNSAARTEQWEPDSHLLCQRKGYFWKMGPSPWFNSLTIPRKRGLSPWEAPWFRLRLHFGLDLLSSSPARSHNKVTCAHRHSDKLCSDFVTGRSSFLGRFLFTHDQTPKPPAITSR